jgi:membrane protein required for colicin V production
LRGIVLVGVALLVYDRAVASNTVPMVDESRSAKIFASFQANIDAAVPDDAPGWILSRYNTLTKACAAPEEAAPAEAAPATPTAPSN